MSQEKASLLSQILFSPDHQPVLINEVLEAFWDLRQRESLRYFDGTFGRGGHYKALKKMAPQMRAVVMDQDLEALNFAENEFKTEVQNNELQFISKNFSHFPESNLELFDMMLLDLGVSSPQLDKSERGFSFYHQGPLDMRMNQQQGVTAEYIINTWSEKDLVALFQNYGEIYKPFRVVRAIVHDRKTKAYKFTQELSSLIERVEGWRKKGFHPATQYFMALRLVVNQELEVLRDTLPVMIKSLTPGGRLAVISFHSLEDRIVKNIFKDSKEWGLPVSKKVIVASEEEQKNNPRSRSAKLRIFERRVQDELRESITT
ncbi:MAG: 16S rRNA (cytosine(1402)-N(4))-methyltransferase RsmH [Bdellovibrionota bacterium]